MLTFLDHPVTQTIACCFAIASILISLLNCYHHLQHYTKPDLQLYIVRIIIIVPIYALGSFLSLLFVEEALYFGTIRDCYEAFLTLILAYCGGDSHCVSVISVNPGQIPHPWPLCFLPQMPTNGRFLRWCKQGTLQFVIIKPVMALLSLIMLGVHEYWSDAYQWSLFVVYNIAYTLALYYLFLFYLAAKNLLRDFSPVKKFFAVKTVVFATYWQSLVISFIPGLSTEDTSRLNDFILCIEDYVLQKPYVEAPRKTFRARTFLIGNLGHVDGSPKSLLGNRRPRADTEHEHELQERERGSEAEPMPRVRHTPVSTALSPRSQASAQQSPMQQAVAHGETESAHAPSVPLTVSVTAVGSPSSASSAASDRDRQRGNTHANKSPQKTAAEIEATLQLPVPAARPSSSSTASTVSSASSASDEQQQQQADRSPQSANQHNHAIDVSDLPTPSYDMDEHEYEHDAHRGNGILLPTDDGDHDHQDDHEHVADPVQPHAGTDFSDEIGLAVGPSASDELARELQADMVELGLDSPDDHSAQAHAARTDGAHAQGPAGQGQAGKAGVGASVRTFFGFGKGKSKFSASKAHMAEPLRTGAVSDA